MPKQIDTDDLSAVACANFKIVMNSGPCLSVAVQDVEFAKDYQYFVTVQFLNEKVE